MKKLTAWLVGLAFLTIGGLFFLPQLFELFARKHCDTLHPVDVQLLADGQIIWAKSKISHAILYQRLHDFSQLKTQPVIRIQEGRDVPDSTVTAFMADLQKAGARCIGWSGIAQYN